MKIVCNAYKLEILLQYNFCAIFHPFIIRISVGYCKIQNNNNNRPFNSNASASGDHFMGILEDRAFYKRAETERGDRIGWAGETICKLENLF